MAAQKVKMMLLGLRSGSRYGQETGTRLRGEDKQTDLRQQHLRAGKQCYRVQAAEEGQGEVRTARHRCSLLTQAAG